MPLKAIAESVGDRFVFDGALCRMEFASELESVCERVFPSARLRQAGAHRSGPDAVRTATWGEFLGDIGFRDEAFVARNVAWWQEVIRVRDISFVVADFAPCALLAARGMGIPAVASGVGYYCPPPELLGFPILMPEHSTRLYDEREMVDIVNRATRSLGVPQIDRLPAVYSSNDQIGSSLAMLDPYDGMRSAPLLPPVADMPSRASSGDGEEIFVYFSTTERNEPALMEAIENLGAPTRVFIPGLEAAAADRLTAKGVIVERQPVPADAIVRRSRVMLNAAQHGTLCLGLGGGIAQVCFPQHLEQAFHGRRAEAAGVALVVDRSRRTSVAEVRSLVRKVYDDEDIGARARALAATLRPLLARDVKGELRRRILAAAA